MAHMGAQPQTQSQTQLMLGGMWGAVPIGTHAAANSVENAFSAWSHATTNTAPNAVVGPAANAVENPVANSKCVVVHVGRSLKLSRNPDTCQLAPAPPHTQKTQSRKATQPRKPNQCFAGRACTGANKTQPQTQPHTQCLIAWLHAQTKT